MATKPIIDIQVNDDAFKRFKELFDDYRAALDEMPESWRTLGEAMESAGDSTEALSLGAVNSKNEIALAAAQAGLIAEELTKAVKAQNTLGDVSHGTNKRMTELAKTAKGLAGEIAGVGKWIIKLGAGALAGLGLGGILGGLGVGALAGAAFSRSRTAGGYGVTPGELASFQVNAQRFLGVGALQSAANAQIDITKAGYLATLGIGNAAGMSPADLAFAELRSVATAYRAAQKSGSLATFMASPMWSSYQALGGNIEDVRRAASDLGGLSAAQAAYHRDIGPLGFGRGTADIWSDFKIQLDRAGMEIETVFINKLGPLVPEFTELSKDIINAIAGFVNSKDFPIIIDDIKGGLKAFGAWLEGPEPKQLWDNAKLLGSEIAAVAEKLKWLLPKPSTTEDKPGVMGHTAQGDFQWAKGALGDAWKRVKGSPEWVSGMLHSALVPKNNPLDITSGSVAGHLLFRQYSTIDEGIRAGAKLLGDYPKNWGAQTLEQAIPIWSGAHGQELANYIAMVEKWSGVSRNKKISDFTREELSRVVAAMSRFENTAVVSPEQVYKALYGTSLAKKATVKPVRDSNTNKGVKISITNSTHARVADSTNAAAVT